MRYVLDTNILLAYLRGSELMDRIEAKLSLTNLSNQLLVSVVTKGEMISLATRNHWGEARRERLNDLLNKLIIIDITTANSALFDTYAEMDCYSQNQLTGKSLPPGKTARKMGKNDLWIAATARLTGATLVTTDGDFDNLNGIYIPIALFKP